VHTQRREEVKNMIHTSTEKRLNRSSSTGRLLGCIVLHFETGFISFLVLPLGYTAPPRYNTHHSFLLHWLLKTNSTCCLLPLSFILRIINQSQRESFLFFFAGRMKEGRNNQRPKRLFIFGANRRSRSLTNLWHVIKVVMMMMTGGHATRSTFSLL